MAKELKVDQLDNGQLVRFISEGSPQGGPEFNYRVKAPLPDGFGFSVGSEIGTPFSGYAAEGMLAQVLAWKFGVSNRVGLVTQKIYQGPQESEFTMDLNFNAYYSARHEVMAPIIKLMLMSVGQTDNINDTQNAVLERLRGFLGTGAQAVNSVLPEGTETIEGGEIGELIKFMRSPGTVSVKVGRVFSVKSAFVSNVVPSFSNVLDHEFLPMSASCNVTVELRHPMTKVRIAEAFGYNSPEQLEGQQ